VLSDEQTELMEFVKEAYDEQKINKWEQSFLDDMLDRYAEYGENLYMSDKQEEILRRIEKKLV
jgi:ribosome assembly protein YihI (activator of Der GTPase)